MGFSSSSSSSSTSSVSDVGVVVSVPLNIIGKVKLQKDSQSKNKSVLLFIVPTEHSTGSSMMYLYSFTPLTRRSISNYWPFKNSIKSSVLSGGR